MNLIRGIVGQGGVAALLQDVFTDTNGTLLTAHTPDVDANGLGWQGNAGYQIQGNLAQYAEASGNAWIGVNVGQGPVHITVDVRIPNGDSWIGVGWGGDEVDGAEPNNTWWLEATAAGPYNLFEQVGGARSTRASDGTVTQGTGWRTWEIIATAASVIVKIDGVERISYPGALSYVGNVVSFKSGAGGGTFQFDNLIVEAP